MAELTEKKKLALAKQRFTLHVALIMHQENESKASAIFRAWCEGDSGLEQRLDAGRA